MRKSIVFKEKSAETKKKYAKKYKNDASKTKNASLFVCFSLFFLKIARKTVKNKKIPQKVWDKGGFKTNFKNSIFSQNCAFVKIIFIKAGGFLRFFSTSFFI